MVVTRLEKLKEILGPDSVKSDTETLSVYTVDGVEPWAVVFPDSAGQISELVRLALEERWGLIPWGSGSKMGMGNVPSQLDLIVCMKRLNRILDMDTANLTVTTQAGVEFKDLQAALAGEENRCYLPHETPAELSDQIICSDREHMGCFVPMWPPFSESATLGGIVASGSSGPTRLLYGLPRDMVLGVRYVAPDGKIIGMGGKTVKNVSGYDMCKLMIGSMGTLGILCEMTLRLLPLPERVGTCLFLFPDLENASDCVDRIFESSLIPAAVEMVNERAFRLLSAEKGSELAGHRYAVAVSLEGIAEAVDRMASEIKEMAMDSGAEKSYYLQEEAHGLFWDAYSNLLTELSKRYGGIASVRLNYPISHYLEVVRLADSLVSSNGIDAIIMTHGGGGLTRLLFLIEPGEPQGADRVVKVIENLFGSCRDIGGNLVVERISPDLKGRVPLWGVSREDIIVMKRIKEQMDPSGLFCPGRFVEGI